jgi:uncharacterized membrane protein YfcA
LSFADSISPDGIQAIQAVLLAVVAAWVAIRTRQLDHAAKKADERQTAHREYCEGLEKRVKALENAQRRLKPKKTTRRPKDRK